MQSTLFNPPPPLQFGTAPDLIAAVRDILKKEATYPQFTALRDYILHGEEKILPMLKKMTIAEIGKLIDPRGSTKDRLINRLYDTLLNTFDISDGCVMYELGGKESYKDARLKKLALVTEDIFYQWQSKREQSRQDLQKALTNPETIAEFKTFIWYHKDGERGLSIEQRIRYDELATGQIRDGKQREEDRKAQLSAVEIGDTEMIIIPTTHTKKNIPLWVVRLSERVPRPIYEDLNQRAKTLGGYYSSYRGNGAIPGFTFEAKEGADLFIQIKDGDVNAEELRAALNLKRTQYRAERVQQKAVNIEQRATQELKADRKTNTLRRARMATSIERRAVADIEFAKTMSEIADRMKNGTIKYIGKLSTIVQLEELYSLLSACKWDFIKVKQMREEGFEYTDEVIDHAKFPYPVLYKDTDVLLSLQMLALDPGKKLAAARMEKRLKCATKDHIILQQSKAIEDFERLFCWSSKHLQSWDSQRHRNQFNLFTRIQKLGFTTIYELRTALRELLEIDNQQTISPNLRRLQEIRELDRKFINLNIDGFFPTPPELAATIVEKANILPGNTVLEPEAGLGHLAEAIAEGHPDSDILCIEQFGPLADALKLKGFDVIQNNFLHYEERTFDRIVMNPPFENMQDVDHVYHAWKLLNPGGRLVAIMAGNKEGSRDKLRQFTEFVSLYGSIEQNHPGAFSSGFRPTGVNTVTVILDKPIF